MHATEGETDALRTAREYWDRVAEEKNFTTPLPLEPLRERLEPGARILDYGCGYGRTLRALADAGFTRARGLDFSERIIARGRALWPDLRLDACGPGRLPLADGEMDAVLLLAVLTCVRRDADQDALLAELGRVLRPGGLLLVNDFLLAPDQRNQERYARFAPAYGTFGVFEIPGGGIMRHQDPDGLRARLGNFEMLSWEEQTFTTMNGHHARGVTLLARKRP